MLGGTRKDTSVVCGDGNGESKSITSVWSVCSDHLSTWCTTACIISQQPAASSQLLRRQDPTQPHGPRTSQPDEYTWLAHRYWLAIFPFKLFFSDASWAGAGSVTTHLGRARDAVPFWGVHGGGRLTVGAILVTQSVAVRGSLLQLTSQCKYPKSTLSLGQPGHV